MANEKAPIDERLDALAQSVELLAASTRDLRAVVEATIGRSKEQREHDQEQRERDTKFLALIADIMKQWADDRTQ